MRILYFGVFFLFLSAVGLSAQETLWQKDIPSSTQDILSGLALTTDGQYLLSGSSIQKQGASSVGSDGSATSKSGYDYHILKLDQQGKKVWDKYFSGNRQDYLNAAASTHEGGFILAGTSYSGLSKDKKQRSFGSSDMWVIRIDENGEEQWQRSIGTRFREESRSVTGVSDLGYIVAGTVSGHPFGFGSKDIVITKLDKSGNIRYQLVMGGKESDEVEKVMATRDGGCLIGIYSQSGAYDGETKGEMSSGEFLNTYSIKEDGATSGSSESYKISFYGKQTGNYGTGDYWLVKLDREGKVEWEKNFGGEEDDHIRTLSISGNGYLVGGESRSKTSGNKQAGVKEGTDLWLVALDENGGEEWQKSYDFSTRDIMMSLNPIKDKADQIKGYLIGGYSQAEGKAVRGDETFWMLYVKADGKEEWRKLVEGDGRKKEERLVSALMGRDGSYVLAGTSAGQLGEENWKVLKLGDKDLDDLIENRDLRIYPNPVEEYCYVEIGKSVWDENNRNEEAEIFLHDMSGRQVQSLKTRQQVTRINTSSLPQGIYVVTAQTKIKSVNTKIVKK